ncbi:MAG: pyrroloquinoline quinone-dependent dehydrogenase [Myxococcota bacterium]
MKIARALGLLLACAAPASAEPAGSGDWPIYAGDAGGQRYSPLVEIDRGNVAELEVAWQIRTGDLDAEPGPPGHMAFQATPILVDGLLVLPTPLGRVLALDPATGEERWRFDATVTNHEQSEYTSRGVAQWLDLEAEAGAPCRRRVFAATIESRLFAIDAATGKHCTDFGRDGEVSLKEGIGEDRPYGYTISSPPTLAGDVVVVGSAIGDNARVDEVKGIVRGYDARTGALRWIWDPIPRSDADPAYAEWPSEGAARTGAANAWSILSYDAARDLVFVPTSSPSPDYYGGVRLGSNRHANSVVALRGRTGELVWEFQTVHHDLWDYDVPAQPVLTSVLREGRKVPAVVQATKMGHVFVLHRETGAPLFPVEERPVPASDVPGEEAAPTQPFPTRPPSLVPQTLRPEDAFGLFFWDRGRCRKKLEALRNEGIFTPPSLRGALHYPSQAGGVNWGSVAIDPTRRVAFFNASNIAFSVRLIPRDDYEREAAEGRGLLGLREFAPMHGTPYGMVREPLLGPLGVPCTPPPWGFMGAFSLDTGELLWRVTLGATPDRVPFTLFEQGLPSLSGVVSTAGGLVFSGNTADGFLRAHDTETGAELWRDRLPAAGAANPMTYAVGGRQYVVIAAGGHGKLGTRRGDWVVAYALQ